MNPDERTELLQNVAATIADYREGEIERPTPEHVDRWLRQFDDSDQEAVLQETAHVLKITYIPKAIVTRFIGNLARNKHLAGADPAAFWRSVGFLRLQKTSESQKDMLEILASVLNDEFGIDTTSEESENRSYVYMDDVVFSGNQIRYDLTTWAETKDVRDAKVHVIVMVYHKGGHWYANREIGKAFRERRITIKWWKVAELEDWRKPGNESLVHVLWPAEIPNDPYVDGWLTAQPEDRARFAPRNRNVQGRNKLFASEAGRHILEQAFLKKGAYIRSLSNNPSPSMRPLGFNKLHGPGFGTMFATYRNCPNNCPLVMWWGDPEAGAPLNQWYPLLPRRTRKGEFDDMSSEEIMAAFNDMVEKISNARRRLP